MERVSGFIKSFINYLGFYLVVIALVCNRQMDIIFTLVNGEFNSIGQAMVDFAGEGMYFFGFMFIPIITIGLHGLFGFLDDAEGFSPKVALTVGLISSIVITAIQVIFRLGFDNYAFVITDYGYPNTTLLPYIMEYRILSNMNMVAIFFLGFSIYSFFISDASYQYIEITTYFDASGMEIGSSTSDSKNAIWLHIVLGLATTLIPIFLANTPLIVFIVFLCLILLFRSRSIRSLVVKSVICTILGLVAITPVILTENEVIKPNTVKYIWGDEEDGERTLMLTEMLYPLDSEELIIDDYYFGFKVSEYAKGVLTDYKNLKYLEVPDLHNSHLGSLFTHDDKTNSIQYANAIPTSLEEICITNDEYIYDYIFIDCQYLKRITLTENTKYITKHAISGCESLELNIYENGSYLGTKDNPYYALMSFIDTSVTEITIHPDTAVIAGGALYGLYYLESFVMPKSVKYFLNNQLLNSGSQNVKSIFYAGSKEDGNKMEVRYTGFDNVGPIGERIEDAIVYFYSETKPTEEGNYWHYLDDNKTPAIWTTE